MGKVISFLINKNASKLNKTSKKTISKPRIAIFLELYSFQTEYKNGSTCKKLDLA